MKKKEADEAVWIFSDGSIWLVDSKFASDETNREMKEQAGAEAIRRARIEGQNVSVRIRERWPQDVLENGHVVAQQTA